MLFACSSGATIRYLEDIFRAVPMPSGMLLQFRYATKYVHPEIVEKIKQDKSAFDGQQVVLTYLNQSPKQRESGKAPRAVPCRLAKIKEIEPLGTSIILVFELGEFVFPKTRKIRESDNVTLIEYNDYQTYLADQKRRSESSCPLPIDWKPENAPQSAKGYWLCDVESPNLELQDISDDPEVWRNWQQLVEELAAPNNDFRDYFKELEYVVFYHLLSICDVRSSNACSIKNNLVEIQNPGEYEIAVYVYANVEEVPKTAWICFSSLIQRTTFHSNPKLAVDSGYDIKKLRFYVTPSTRRESEIITIDLREDHDGKYGKAQYDLILDISPRYSSLFVSSMAVGLAASVSGLVALWKATPTGFPYALAAVVVLAACGLSFVGSYYASNRK